MSDRRTTPAGLRAAGVFFCALVGVSAAAADTPGAACLRVEDEKARLACFDEAIGAAVREAGTDAAVATVPAPASAASGAAADAEAPPLASSETGLAYARETPPPAGQLIETAWGFLPDSRKAYVRLYQPNYLLFARYTTDVNREPYEPLFDAFAEDYDFEDVEAKFQLSFKGRLATTEDRRWGLWFAYTQQSNWQVYASDISSPFRETNYMPELFGSFRPGIDVGGLKFNLLNFGYTHQSNGRADPISRSWDRLFVEGGLDGENFALIARAWTRIELGDDYEDDNPDILDYMGHGQVTALYQWRGNSFTLMGRGNLSTGKGAAQFTWASRPILGPMRVYFQLFSGYGESLIDYDWNQTTVGLGVTLNDLL
jgi:phospholipase A1